MTREVEARLKISAVDKTGKTLKGVADKMADINKRAAAFNRQQGALAKGTQAAFGAMLRYAAPAALAYGAKKALTDFAAIEREMNRIGITANASATETKAAFGDLQTITKQLAMGVDDGVTALDTLVASGMDLKEAMAFLPSVLATAQASGAATDDIANTAIKAASALKLETSQMQHAFDIMVAGGKAGQFELKDMATYIPDLANSFSSLGYTGEDGLKKLVSILQTIREDTGSASSAATYAQNIFGKIYSSDTATKFSKMGIDLRKEMDAARKSGEDTVAAFVRISKEAINGDLSKLPLLFTDEQFRLGMQSLMTSADSYEKFLKTVNSTEVDGTVFKDLERVTGDTQASIDRLSSSWDKMINSIGKGAAVPAVPVMNAISRDVDYGSAIRESLGKQGKSYLETETWMAMNLPVGGLWKSAAADKLALDGGYRDPEFLKRMWQGPNMPQGARLPEFPGGDRKLDPRNLPMTGVPTPGARPSAVPAPRASPAEIYGQYADSRNNERRAGFEVAKSAGMPTSGPGLSSDFFRMPSKDEFKDALKIDLGGEDAGRQVADGGKEAGKAIEDSAAFIKIAGYDVSTAISNAAKDLAAAASRFGSFGPGTVNGPPRPNADTGRSMPSSANRPMNAGMK
jgi:TP901 family phage tail tape measure protein